MAALSVAGLTACGDKVNVTQPAPDSAVTQVTVSPASQNMNVGDKITLVATVIAGPQQTNRNVTWTSSDATVASVDAAGVVTANKGGVATIIATSVANTAIKGNAVITVAAQVPATVSIGQINQTVCVPNGACTSVPAVLNNVANQLDVTLNVDAGTQKISEVDLIMNCGGADTVVQKQTFSTADVAPLSEDASAPTTLSFNTAAFNPATGAVAFKNGQCTIKAKAITTAGTQVASGTQQLTLNNADTVAATIATTPVGSQKASATDAGGLLWRAGSVTVTAVPVIYTANITAASGSISLVNVSGAAGVKGNATTIANGATFAVATNIAPASGAISATFAKDASANGVDSVTVAGVGVTVTTVTSAGNPGPTILASNLNMVRLDNFAPPNKVKVDLTKFNGLSGWLGKSFVFTTAAGTVDLGSNTAVADSAAWDHGGVDNVTFTTQSRPNGAGSSAWATFAKVTDLAETSASSGAGSYDLRLVMCDALNNCTNGSAIPFGVDLTPPSLQQLSGPTDKEIFNIDSVVPATASFNVVDTSNTAGITPSGPPLGQEVLVTIQTLQPSGASSSKTACFTGVATGSGTAITCKAPVTQNQASVPLPTTDGEFTATVIGIDQAGNQSASMVFKYYVDKDAPSVSGGVTIPNPITTGTSFALSATDSMDVAAGAGSLSAGGFSFFETGTSSSNGVAFDNVLTRTGTVTVALATFYRGVSTTIDVAGTAPAALNIRAVDAANNISTNTSVALPAANMSTPGTVTSTGAAGITAAAAFVNPAADTVGQTLTLSDSLTAAGPTTASPFTQVCFYYTSPSGTPGGTGGPQGVVAGELVKIGCTSSLSAVGSAPRKLGYSITFKVPEILRGTTPTIYAVGQTSNLDALVTSAGTLTVAP